MRVGHQRPYQVPIQTTRATAHQTLAPAYLGITPDGCHSMHSSRPLYAA